MSIRRTNRTGNRDLGTISPSLENIVVDGYVTSKGEGLSSATPSQVMGDYFTAMRIPLLQGRFFDPGDRADAQLVVIVNHKFAQRYWPKQSPLGKPLRIGLQIQLVPG
jgi:MacB-like protein